MKSPRDIRIFQTSLRRWYRNNGRDLPWRRTRDPYAILVSEFMLQQTQVITVIPYYERWLGRFPNFGALAAATESEVLHAWQGLGYYSRARHLHATAKIISGKHGGRCPRTFAELRTLPGIGRYSANAIATFAFDQSLPIVEANIGRLLARICNISLPIDSSAGRDAIWSRAAELVPTHSARDFNSALMDLGATVCLARAPKCGVCPVKLFCRARDPLSLPVKKARAKTVRLTERHVFAQRRGKILLQQCRKRWRGMWILPPLKSLPPNTRPVQASVFPFTHHQVALQVFAIPSAGIARPGQRWFPIHQLDSIPIPSPHRRVLNGLLPKPAN